MRGIILLISHPACCRCWTEGKVLFEGNFKGLTSRQSPAYSEFASLDPSPQDLLRALERDAVRFLACHLSSSAPFPEAAAIVAWRSATHAAILSRLSGLRPSRSGHVPYFSKPLHLKQSFLVHALLLWNRVNWPHHGAHVHCRLFHMHHPCPLPQGLHPG